MDVICTLEAAKRIRELEQECITQEREKFKYIERAKTERDDALAAERQLAEAQKALQKIADNYGGCHCDHTDDNCCEHPSVGEFCPHCISEIALSNLAERVLSAAGDATVDADRTTKG